MSGLALTYSQFSHTYVIYFFFNDTATTEIYTLPLHDALPISAQRVARRAPAAGRTPRPVAARRARDTARRRGLHRRRDRSHAGPDAVTRAHEEDPGVRSRRRDLPAHRAVAAVARSVRLCGCRRASPAGR